MGLRYVEQPGQRRAAARADLDFLIVRSAGWPWLALREVKSVGGRVWIVRFSESGRPTLIRTSRGVDLPAQGRFWIDPASGRVVRTELLIDDGPSDVRTRIVVDYRQEPRLGIWVPVQMRERYERPVRLGSRAVECVASYSDFKRFEVQTDTTFRPQD